MPSGLDNILIKLYCLTLARLYQTDVQQNGERSFLRTVWTPAYHTTKSHTRSELAGGETLDHSRPVPVQKDQQRFREVQIVGLDAAFKMYFSRFLVEQREIFFVLI